MVTDVTETATGRFRSTTHTYLSPPPVQYLSALPLRGPALRKRSNHRSGSEHNNMNDLRDRFEAISKGRSVRVNERRSTFLNRDFVVSYEEETASYVTEFTHHGHFEEAYSFIERWIKRHAEKLDGSYTPPPTGHIDCRGVGLYWMLERPFNRYWADVQDAIRQQYALLERERPNEGVSGEIKVGSRLMALRGFLDFLKPVADDVQAAILSPSSVECLVALGLDVFSLNQGDRQDDGKRSEPE